MPEKEKHQEACTSACVSPESRAPSPHLQETPRLQGRVPQSKGTAVEPEAEGLLCVLTAAARRRGLWS